MACKAYRDWARDVKGITEPEMSVLQTPSLSPSLLCSRSLHRIIPASAHAAFDKAGSYFGIKARRP
jgi:sphinganine-1-phosphate aldolase